MNLQCRLYRQKQKGSVKVGDHKHSPEISFRKAPAAQQKWPNPVTACNMFAACKVENRGIPVSGDMLTENIHNSDDWKLSPKTVICLTSQETFTDQFGLEADWLVKMQATF